MTEQHTPRSWLWPDHVIGKRESRTLREEHNRMVNVNIELLKALETLVRGRPTTPPNHAVLGKDSVAYMNWLAFEAARAAIARARGE